MKFFSRLKKEVWKVVRGILILGVVVSLVVTIVTYGKRIRRPDTFTAIIDSDSGNEIDDLFAITLAQVDPKFEIIGLSSAQYNLYPNSSLDSTVFASQKINENLLKLHDTINTPHPIGAVHPLFVGKSIPDSSAASKFIIEQVQKLDYGEKLNVITLGAVTNLAAAIKIDSTISAKIRWYGTGLKYNDRDQIWNKNESNVRNDLDAMDYLLNKVDLETYLMPSAKGNEYVFEKMETFDLFQNRAYKYQYLVDQWNIQNRNAKTRTMLSVGLIQAIMNPDISSMKDVWTPPENTRRRITVYTSIDAKKMLKEFRKIIQVDMGYISPDSK